MRKSIIAVLAVVAALATTCAARADHPLSGQVDGGWQNYPLSHVRREIFCDGRPVLLTGDHTKLRLSGDCPRVRVAGRHNDIFVDLLPGGMIEITGAHNDVTWHAARPYPRPRLVNAGSRNTFHIATR
jgi:hypothetical protein